MVDSTDDNNPNDDDADVFDDSFDFDDDIDPLLTPEDEGTESMTLDETLTASPDLEETADFGSTEGFDADPSFDDSDDTFGADISDEPMAQPMSGYPEPASSRKPMMFGIIALAIIGVLIWQGIGYFSGAEKNIQPKPQPEPQPLVVTPPKPVVAEIPKATPSPQVLEKLDSIQDQVKSQTQQYQDQIKRLEGDLETANQNAVTINKNMLTLQQQMNSLAGMVQNLSNQIQAVRQEARKKPAPPPKKPAPKKETVSKESFASPNLTVYAIIPGRAWLREPTGKTLTVTEGDRLGEFGKILKIDATNGVVITSSGVTLR